MTEPLELTFDDQGLLPVVVQDQLTGEIRMVAHATLEAVRATLETGLATFWSRSRRELWEKGRTSGNAIRVTRVLVDCDGDCLIYSSEPQGPSCHSGAVSCFFRELDRSGAVVEAREPCQTFLARLEMTLRARGTSTASASYTKSLYDRGPRAIGDKVREEADELARALEGETDGRVAEEAADLFYHVLVGLLARQIAWRDVLAVLERRGGVGGHAEKRGRGPSQL